MAIIEFTIHVDNPAQVSALYNKIQIWRSPDQSGSPVPFAEITADEPTAAKIDGTVEGPWNINGQTLNVVLDGSDPVPLVFSGSNPFSLQTVINLLNALFPTFAADLASEVPTDTEKVRLTSPTDGTSSILLLSGNAAPTLGLSTAKVNGKGARPLLSSNTEEYLFRDFDGLVTYWYKTRYYNSNTGAVSSFSEPFQAGPGAGLPGSSVCTGKIALADASGSPLVGRRVIFVPISSQVIADGSGNNYGVLPSVDRIIVTTDDNGRATITLVKGQRLKVFIEGTSFQREFVVPSADFDVMTVATTAPDPLSIVVAPPIPIRVGG